MFDTEPIGYFALALLILLTVIAAMGAGSILRRRGIASVSPLRYLPHLVLLLSIALAPVVVNGLPTLGRAMKLLGAVVLIWLVAFWFSSRASAGFSRKSSNTRRAI